MNYIAHFLLSFEHEPLIVGNFVADAVKGKTAILYYPPPVQRGIYLHRTTDTFTDQHPTVQQSKRLLYPEFGKWAPVLVDIYYDYLLTCHWHHHAPQPSFSNFTQHTYTVLTKHANQLPDPLRIHLPNMIAHNWLAEYSTPQGIQRAFARMAQHRPTFPPPEAAVSALLRHQSLLQQHFNQFFPLLQAHVIEWIQANPETNPTH